MENHYHLVFCACPDKEVAQHLARLIIENRLTACVNIVSGITSLYWWKNRIETSEEQLLVIKTRKELYPELESTLRLHHPYEIPEIIAIPIEQGLPEYLEWLNNNLK